MIQVLRVSAGGLEFAIELALVRGIERPIRWARLPWSPDYVRGVSQLAGQPVAVVDLAARLGLPDAPPQRAAGVVLIDSAEPVGLSVTGIAGVDRLDTTSLSDPGARAREAAVTGVAPDGTILLVGEALVDGRSLRPLLEALPDLDPEGGEA